MPRAAVHRFLVVLTVLALCAVACTPSSPEEEVAAVRGQYTVELVSFRVEQIPGAAEESPAEAAEEGAGESSSAAEGEIAVEVPDHLASNLVNNLYFDLLVSTSANEPLSTLTVDLTHASLTQEEKRVYRLPLDVTGVVKGSGEQITATLENVEDFEDGDLFAVEIRSSVDESERSEYPEFGS